VNDDTLSELLRETAAAVQRALGDVTDWGLAGTRPGQHHSDLMADAAALAVLDKAGVGVLSEESGARSLDRDLVVVIDPLDGSTNAAHGIPWFATSLCAVDDDGPRAALVVNLVSGVEFEAVRGGGARASGSTLTPSSCTTIGDALVGLSGLPPQHLGWRQFRALGAIALDLCSVASGVLDGFVDCSRSAHGPWDYLGGFLICREAGALVADAADRDLAVVDYVARRTPVAAATPELLHRLRDARRGWPVTESTAAKSG
jgi:fructose-1,6-bisphosphatase/inositol monophosphatase family enzyme